MEKTLACLASCLKARQGGLAQKICDLTAELSELLVERALGARAAPAFAERARETLIEALKRSDDLTERNGLRGAGQSVASTGTR